MESTRMECTNSVIVWGWRGSLHVLRTLGNSVTKVIFNEMAFGADVKIQLVAYTVYVVTKCYLIW